MLFIIIVTEKKEVSAAVKEETVPNGKCLFVDEDGRITFELPKERS